MTETTAEKAEAARTRRRWISLAELIGILALVISAASLWDSHQSRVQTEVAAKAPTKASVAPLVLTASADAEGETLRLAANGADRVIQTETIVFPTALGVDSVDTVGNPRIEAGWFASALRSALGDDRKHGRLPVGIITHYTDNGTDRDDVAIYDIGHSWRSRLLNRDAPVLEGITLVARGGKDLQGRLDARWRKLHPAAK